jgi:hypothetical protein
MSGRRAILIADAIALAFALVWWGQDLVRAARAHHAPVSAMRSLPNVPFAIAALVVCILAAVAALWGLVRARDASFKGYRLLPIAAIVMLFADIFLVPTDRVPIASPEQLALSLQLFAQSAQQKIEGGRVPTSEALLSSLASALGSPPYLVDGVPATAYRVQLRRGCLGPLQEAPGAEVGTLLYCVAPDEKRAWVSAVALPAESEFGRPAVFSRAGVVQFVEIVPEEP